MRKYPILVVGFGIRRWEYAGGAAVDYPEYRYRLTIYEKPGDVGPGPSHLQKFTPWGPGFLISRADESLPWWKNCYHFWFIFRQQLKKPNGEHIPGSERVLYWRFGWWRWDAGDDKYIGPFTWYGPGLHWD